MGPIPHLSVPYPLPAEAVPYPLKSRKGHTEQAFQSRTSRMSPAEKVNVFFLHFG